MSVLDEPKQLMRIDERLRGAELPRAQRSTS